MNTKSTMTQNQNLESEISEYINKRIQDLFIDTGICVESITIKIDNLFDDNGTVIGSAVSNVSISSIELD